MIMLNRLKTRELLNLILGFYFAILNSEAQTVNIDSVFFQFSEHYKRGELLHAEDQLLSVLHRKSEINERYVIAIYNNLGVVNQMLGKYDKAVEYYDQAELVVSGKKEYLKDLADIYSNKGNIHFIRRSFDLASGYYEKSIRIYKSMNLDDKGILLSLASTYLNAGIASLHDKKFDRALDYFNKSLELKSRNDLEGTELVYLNMAKTEAESGNTSKAQYYYIKSINSYISDFHDKYFRLAEIYFSYGLFLDSEKKYTEAYDAHQKALEISLYNYGNKHPLVALAYKNLGDHFFKRSDYKKSLDYYQRSLISVVSNFNDPDILSNPAVDSSLFDIRLYDNLKSKAKALELLAYEYNDPDLKLKTLNKSLETIELALMLTGRIRTNYITEEAKIYLSENEKGTYLFAIHMADMIYSLTGDESLVEKMYGIAREEKAAVLRNDMAEDDLLFLSGIPDSITKRKSYLEENIASHSKMIRDESLKIRPDSNKVSLWKDVIFNMNLDLEKIRSDVIISSPHYNEMLKKIEPLELSDIQNRLHNEETIIDYILSSQYINGQRELYIFLTTTRSLKYFHSGLDTCFNKNVEIISRFNINPFNNNFSEYTSALNYMYIKLIEPLEKYLAGHRIRIIHDGETAFLPFEAFLMNKPEAGYSDYESLNYLINKYTISYCYTSSLCGDDKNNIKKRKKVYAFYPEYDDSPAGFEKVSRLPYAESEIESIFTYFNGRKYAGTEASETNFRMISGEAAIFHLAMHSISDTANSKYSYLFFGNLNDTLSDGRLYNYEISVARMRSPLVVLSACNSGTGTLYHGEGMMSLARGFTLAGASSVVRTAWEINDETSAGIISRFYYYLSKGRSKDEALRQSKMDYLKNSPPAFASPYYWAAYEIIGDNSPVCSKTGISTLISIITGLMLVILLLYLRKRRIFSARS